MSGGFTTRAYRSADLVAFATALFERAGLDPDKAGTSLRSWSRATLLGHSRHGLALAAPYLAALADGSMAREGAPAGRVRSWRRPVLGPTPSARAMAGRGAIDQALARVPAYGIAAAAIRESHHTGCLTAYLERAAAKAA